MKLPAEPWGPPAEPASFSVIVTSGTCSMTPQKAYARQGGQTGAWSGTATATSCRRAETTNTARTAPWRPAPGATRRAGLYTWRTKNLWTGRFQVRQYCG